MSGTKTVITTFKNEAPYILEWVAHYRTLGFDHIVVFTNDCSDGTNRILRRLAALGEVSFHINRVGAGGIHRSALRQARRLDVVKEADWLFVCDIDEFLNIHVGSHRIDDLIEASGSDVDAISIPWKIFSNNGRTLLRNDLVTAQFTDAERAPVDGGATRRFVKTLFRPGNKIKRIGLHGPVLHPDHAQDYLWAVPGNARLSRESLGGHVPAPFGYETAQLNHYAVRSVDSYLLKKHRGRANHMSQSLSSAYWDRWNRGGAEDRSITRYIPQIRERIATYQEDEVLRKAHHKGFHWHKDLVTELRQDPEYAALRTACEGRMTERPAESERPSPPIRPAEPLNAVMAQTKDASLAPIGSLWIGTTLSYVEQACLLSFVRQGHPVTLFTYGPVENVPRDITVADARDIHDVSEIFYSKFGTPVVQSDIFRLRMIQRTGMIWADTDMVCLRPIETVDGHVHGYFSDSTVCNALLRLPPDSPALAAYLDYVSDPFPVPPWWSEREREDAMALKAAGKWKHATAQKHDIYGPPALTHFLRQTGEIAQSQPRGTYFPLPFKELDAAIEPGDLSESHFSPETRAVHLWGRRLRWRLPQLGLQAGSFIHDQLCKLEINPEIAPIPTDGQSDIWSPAVVLPRRTANDDVIASCDITLKPRQKRWLTSPGMDAAIRLAEHTLKERARCGQYSEPMPDGYRRGIDDHGPHAQQVFRLASSIYRYAVKHGALPDLLRPRDAIEKLMVWKTFGAMPIPTPADKLTAHEFAPAHLQDALLVPDRPWISDDPTLPPNDAIAPGLYYLKANHSHGVRRLQFPLDDATRAEMNEVGPRNIAKDHGFWAGEWWYRHIPRRLFLERHLVADERQDVPDWKLWTFGGRVELVQVDLARSSNHIQIVYDRDFNRIEHELFFKTGPEEIAKPDSFDTMIAVAEGICRSLDFARVDLYDTPRGIVVGEVTLCPFGANQAVRSSEMNERLSAAWDRTQLFGGPVPAPVSRAKPLGPSIPSAETLVLR